MPYTTDNPRDATLAEIKAARRLAHQMRGRDVWPRLDTIVKQRYLDLVRAS